MFNEFIELYPADQNAGVDSLTPQRFPKKLAERMVKTKKWSYEPIPATGDDVAKMLVRAKTEISGELTELHAEKERLRLEREELEALRVEVLTAKRGKKAEV